MVLYSCGCGVKTQAQEEARGHVAQSGHTMTASGLVRPEEVGVVKKTRPVSQMRYNPPPKGGDKE